MNDPKIQQEPSIEEILASIRRIMSEDDAEAQEAQGTAPGVVVEAPLVEAEDESTVEETKDEVFESTKEIEDDSDDEVLELTDQSEIVDIMDVEEKLEPIEAEASTLDQMVAPSLDTGLISPPPSNEATSQFSVLAAAVAAERLGQSMGVGAHTIEGLVKEVMRPMIKEWLDENLPALVERLVGRENDLMARRAVDGIDD